MITNLLPGLRELRAPLAAGYVWILALWLAVRPILPTYSKSSGPYRDVLDLANWAGKTGTFAAVVFIAYLIGLLSIATFDFANSASAPIFIRLHLWWLTPASRQTSQVDNALRDVISEVLAKRILEDAEFRSDAIDHAKSLQSKDPNGSRWRLMDKSALNSMVVEDANLRKDLLGDVIDFGRLTPDVRSDLYYLAPRLLGRESELYAEYDRLKSETVFRHSLFPPILGLSIVLATDASPWFLAGIFVAVAFLYLGAQSSTEADWNLAFSLAAGRIESDEVGRLKVARIPFRPL